MKKIFLYLILMFLFAGALWMVLSQKPKAKPEYIQSEALPAAQLYREFDRDESLANANYLNKIIRVHGTVGEWKRDNRGAVQMWLAENGRLLAHARLDQGQLNADQKLGKNEPVVLVCRCAGMADVVELVDCRLESGR